MTHSLIRTGRGVFLLPAALLSLSFGLASPANATAVGTYNQAEVNIRGGNAAALNSCYNAAIKLAKHDLPVQSNTCRNAARAEGGTVTLENVLVTVIQSGSTPKTHNNASVAVVGGDAVAVSSCVNYMQGTADAVQKNNCKSASEAIGGSVKLKNVDITVIQEG